MLFFQKKKKKAENQTHSYFFRTKTVFKSCNPYFCRKKKSNKGNFIKMGLKFDGNFIKNGVKN